MAKDTQLNFYWSEKYFELCFCEI